MKERANKRTLRGISYCRVSTFDQAFNPDGSIKEEGSPESQRKRCEEQIKHMNLNRAKDGISYEIIEHLYERGFSGKDTNRPAYKQMEAIIQSGKIQFIMATELSRLSRSVIDFLKLLALCQKHNVHVNVMGLENFDTSTAIGKVLIVILIALAAFEREMTSERVRANAFIRLIRDGRINGGAPILGLERDPNNKDQYVASTEGLIAVEKILKLFMKVSSKRKLLLLAKELGIKGRKGEDVTNRELDYIFLNVQWRYRGLWFANIENMGDDDESIPENKRFKLIPLKHGRVIDEKLLNDVQSKLADSYKKTKRVGTTGFTYLLSNILFYEDGSPMKADSAKHGTYRYYKSKVAKVKTYCDPMEKKVVERLKGILTDNAKFQDLVEQSIRGRDVALASIDAEISQVEQELKQCQHQNLEIKNQLLAKLGDSADGKSDRNEGLLDWLKDHVNDFNDKRDTFDKKLRFLRESKEDVLTRTGLKTLRETVREFVANFDKLTGTERRNLLEKIVRRVVLRRDNKVEIRLAIEPNLISPPPPVIGRNQISISELNGVTHEAVIRGMVPRP